MPEGALTSDNLVVAYFLGATLYILAPKICCRCTVRGIWFIEFLFTEIYQSAYCIAYKFFSVLAGLTGSIYGSFTYSS